MEQNSNTPNMSTPPLTQTPILPPQKSSVGPLIGTGIIILLMAVGGLYFWGAKLNQDSMNNAPPVILGDDSAGLPPTSTSDTVAAIEADISATDLETFDAEIEADMQAIEASL